MQRVIDIVHKAGNAFQARLESVRNAGGIQQDQYVHYLQMQYHLTKGVQRHFLTAASHPCMVRRRKFREFLFNFALEEELHYLIAQKDLEQLREVVGPCPFDVKLWWTYFDRVVVDRPFVRLGGTCVLENLGSLSAEVARSILADAPFISKNNSRFLEIHMHEALPHGDQILEALDQADPDAQEIDDLAQGAEEASILYLRMVDWALHGDPAWTNNLASTCSHLPTQDWETQGLDH